MLENQPTSSYIPRATLFAPLEVMAIKLSPDSKFLAYVKGEPSGVMNLYISAISEYHQNNSLTSPRQKFIDFFGPATQNILSFYKTPTVLNPTNCILSISSPET